VAKTPSFFEARSARLNSLRKKSIAKK